MRHGQFVFTALFAASLQWWHALNTLGVIIDGRLAITAYICIAAVAAAYALKINLTWRGLLAVLAVVWTVDLTVSVARYIADVGSHSRDIPLSARPIISLIFAAIASSPLLIPVAAQSLQQRSTKVRKE